MISLFAASATFSLLSLFSYKSRLDGARKLAFGILLFSVVASPFISAVTSLVTGGIENLIPPADIPEGEGDEIFEESFCLGIKNAICEKFGIKSSNVRILTAGFSKNEWRAEKIRVILSGKASAADYHEIEKYINNMEIGDCRVEVEIG